MHFHASAERNNNNDNNNAIINQNSRSVETGGEVKITNSSQGVKGWEKLSPRGRVFTYVSMILRGGSGSKRSARPVLLNKNGLTSIFNNLSLSVFRLPFLPLLVVLVRSSKILDESPGLDHRQPLKGLKEEPD